MLFMSLRFFCTAVHGSICMLIALSRSIQLYPFPIGSKGSSDSIRTRVSLIRSSPVQGISWPFSVFTLSRLRLQTISLIANDYGAVGKRGSDNDSNRTTVIISAANSAIVCVISKLLLYFLFRSLAGTIPSQSGSSFCETAVLSMLL